ncbi:uncharacterized protein LOC115238611 isoform X2 [Formica exsecta]|uniref:uncharacterized protein LOC115238611 isoform X2 n=1 Tax=Formica exsecta TaxID=72781 RepID=UPI001143F0FD|nr:uncharacterized protein LOC115238611 isoform X2 [Formica exsecta]
MSVIHGRISSRRKDSGTNGARVIAGFNPDIRSPDYEVSIRQRPFRFTLRENLTTVESGQLISSLINLVYNNSAIAHRIEQNHHRLSTDEIRCIMQCA